MPELPEVETIVRELKQTLEGKRISHVDVLWERSFTDASTEFKKKVVGQSLDSIYRRGKYICFQCSGDVFFTVHLRMTGKLVFDPTEKEQNHIRVKFVIGEDRLYFVDVRKFGKITLYETPDVLDEKLGVEPLSKAAVFNVLKNYKRSRAIKTVLLDQSILAGLGNIYVDESLFLSKIHPITPFSQIPMEKMRHLSGIIPKVLKKSIKSMGTTLSDYRNTSNIAGQNQNYLMVYGQSGMQCKDCGSIIEKIVCAQRGTHFCPECQKI